MPPKRPPGATGNTPPEAYFPKSRLLPEEPPDEGMDPYDTSTLGGWLR